MFAGPLVHLSAVGYHSSGLLGTASSGRILTKLSSQTNSHSLGDITKLSTGRPKQSPAQHLSRAVFKGDCRVFEVSWNCRNPVRRLFIFAFYVYTAVDGLNLNSLVLSVVPCGINISFAPQRRAFQRLLLTVDV